MLDVSNSQGMIDTALWVKPLAPDSVTLYAPMGYDDCKFRLVPWAAAGKIVKPAVFHLLTRGRGFVSTYLSVGTSAHIERSNVG